MAGRFSPSRLGAIAGIFVGLQCPAVGREAHKSKEGLAFKVSPTGHYRMGDTTVSLLISIRNRGPRDVYFKFGRVAEDGHGFGLIQGGTFLYPVPWVPKPGSPLPMTPLALGSAPPESNDPMITACSFSPFTFMLKPGHEVTQMVRFTATASGKKDALWPGTGALTLTLQLQVILMGAGFTCEDEDGVFDQAVEQVQLNIERR